MLTTRNICYNLNLFDTSCRKSLDLGINTEIFTNKINIWKNIYKTALMRVQTRINNKFDNYLDYNHFFNKPITLSRKLIPIISKGLFFKPRFSNYLNILSLNSNFKIVCNYIILLLILNQL